MKERRHVQRPARAQLNREREEAVRAIEGLSEAVDDVEAGDPEEDREAEDDGGPREHPSHRDPRADRRDRETQPENEVRERRHALRVRVAEDDEERDGRKREAERIEPGGREGENGRREARRRPTPSGTDTRPAGMSAFRPAFTASIAWSRSVEGHRGRARASTIATKGIQRSVRAGGAPPAARTAARSANGRAKIVCAKVTREK